MTTALKVLVVEDSQDDTDLILKELRRVGFEPTWRRVEVEADFLAEIKKRPDIIISDNSMPQFKGLRALELLRERGWNIPFILVSGTIGEEMAVEAMKCGATDYLMKGQIARLGSVVERSLEEKKLWAQRQRAEEQIRRTQRALRHMLAHSPAVFYTLRIEGGKAFPVLVSDNVERLLGFSPAECMSADWWLRGLHPKDRDRALAKQALGMAHGGYSIEYRIRHKDGTYRWIEDRNHVLRGASGEPREIVGVWTDISERKRAEAAARASEEKFRQLAEGINEVFWITDAATQQMLYVSPAYEKIWGRTCESIYKSPQSWHQAIHPDDHQRVLTAALNKQEHGDYDETYRILRPDGSVRWIRDKGFPVRNAAGEVYRIVGTAEDITEHKATEEQLSQAQKMEGIGLMAGGVAHDFNNILTIIQVNLELILMAESNLQAEGKECLAAIAKATGQAADLNRQLLTFSRREAMQKEPLDLNDLTADFTKMLRRIVGEHIQVQNHFAPAMPLLIGDPGMIEQVLMNLAVNARDAMPNGGQLIIGTEVAVIDKARAKSDPRTHAGRFACLSVRDTGTGIAPENMSRIFEPFFTTKGVGKGTGLGLATVFSIAQQHHGWVDVASEVGAGTTFRVFLPLSSKKLPAPQRSVAQEVRGGAERILLVEDDETVRHVVLHILENYGYTVMEADSGIAAQKAWTEQDGQFDLLITNMVMPGGLTGLELIELLRGAKPGLKVMLVSGYSPEPGRGGNACAKDITFLRKPLSTRLLAETVRQCLDAD